jgi:CheY-like chemotaxis protein
MESGSILIVDDEPEIRDALGLALELEGYRVISAANGRDALSVLREQVPALVLLDLMMPVMDGAELLRVLRDDPRLRGVPVYLITAFSQISPEAAARAQGYLGKPVDLDRLLEIAAHHLGRS